MKILKIAIYIVLGIVALLAILSFVTPTAYKVERSIVISAPKDAIHANLRSLKSFYVWSPWSKLDPNMQNTYEGTDGEVGSKNTWSGNKDVGKGSQEVISITDNEIRTKLTFIEPFESTSIAYFIVNGDSTSTKVTWGMEGENPRPFNVMGLFMSMDAMIGKDYETGLNSLKGIMEK